MKLSAEEQVELDQARQQSHRTLRPTVEALEARMFTPTPVLDHGFVRLVDYMGDDAAVVQAARVSYGKGTRKRLEDRGLIRYLMRHAHTSPFEMCELKLHIKMPIFVARQWIRHRTANVNEVSARYSILDREFYLPRPEDLAVQSTDNKQGRGSSLSEEEAAAVLHLLKRDAEQVHDTYEGLMGRFDLARELARINLGLNTYTQWYWKVDLHNLLHFLRLRLHPHAQYEIRVYGDVIADLVKLWTPLSWEAFEDYRLGGSFLSRQGIDLVRKALRGQKVSRADSGLSKREWRELLELLELDPGAESVGPSSSPG